MTVVQLSSQRPRSNSSIPSEAVSCRITLILVPLHSFSQFVFNIADSICWQRQKHLQNSNTVKVHLIHPIIDLFPLIQIMAIAVI